MTFDKSKVAHRMKVLRAERSMSQQDLAEKTGLNINSISRYETAENNMNLESAYKICDAFDVALDDLVGRDTPKKVG